ncbi:hypothetical protein RhiirA1_537842 [Rhizophagus irregularis]|uniref:Uncharacterized protein n=1 Tax=Rhizophagus irregularis TaxID=588596 RepID=A0A2N0RJ31_9GLOM|nr:hypothetical protein RhiirA1_537842 [Rhizophagus irregularis]
MPRKRKPSINLSKNNGQRDSDWTIYDWSEWDELFCEIKTKDEIEKFRCGLLLQGEDSITEYYSEVKRCNDVVKLCKDHLKNVFINELENKNSVLIKFGYNHPLDITIHANPERRSTAQKNFAEVKGQRSAKLTGLISDLQASSSENYNC